MVLSENGQKVKRYPSITRAGMPTQIKMAKLLRKHTNPSMMLTMTIIT
jgi:hypothetical protein